jgi:CRISPR type IV-associated protein Csf2
MSQPISIVIKGVVTTTSPAIQVSPSSDGSTTAMNIAHANGSDLVPYISANSVRGRIRRQAANRVFQSLANRGLRIDRRHFLSIVRGQYGRSSIGGNSSYASQVEATRNVFAGLFGGGTMMIKSKFQAGNLIPLISGVTDALVPSGVTTANMLKSVRDARTKLLLTARDDLATIPAFDILEGGAQAWEDHQVEAGQERTAVSEDGKSVDLGKNSLRMIVESWAIAPGVPLTFMIRADNLTKAQAGLLLHSVNDWCMTNEIGGMASRGYGHFAANLQVNHIVDGREDPKGGSTITSSTGLGKEAWVTECIDAAKKEIDAIDQKILELVYPIMSDADVLIKNAKKLKAVQGKTPKQDTKAKA